MHRFLGTNKKPLGVSRVSLGGAVAFVSLAAILLVGIYRMRRDS